MLTFWLRQLLVWGAAALAIFLSYRLYCRFRRTYLRDWFLFVVVFNLGLYIVHLLRTVSPGLVKEAGQAAARLEMVFDALLIRPLVVIGLLFFLRFILGLLDVAVRRLWRLLAVFFLLAQVTALAVLAVRYFAGGGREAYAVLVVVSDWLVIGSLYGALGFMLAQTARHETEPRQQPLRNLGIVFFLCQTVLVFFPAQEPPPLAGFFLVLPPLLYLWRMQGVLLAGRQDLALPDATLSAFLADFGLTERERQIVALICKGWDNRAVADKLFVSVPTVKHHVTAIFRKMKVRNRIQLANRVSNARRDMGREARHPG